MITTLIITWQNDGMLLTTFPFVKCFVNKYVKFFFAGISSADAVIDVAFVKIRFWYLVVGEKFVFDEAYEEVGVPRSHFGSHCNTVDLFLVVVTKRKKVECENQLG